MNVRNTAITLFAVATCSAAWAQPVASEKIRWIGEFIIGGHATPIVLRDRSGTPGAVSGIDLPGKGVLDVPLKNVRISGDLSHFEMQAGPELTTFDGERTGDRIRGSVAQGGKQGQFTLVRTEVISPARLGELAGSYQLAPGRVIDISPMDAPAGQLVYVDKQALRKGALIGQSDSRFISGPSLNVPYPIALRAEFMRDRRGLVTGVRWNEGKITLLGRKISNAPSNDQHPAIVSP
jgi:hypothetical protein